MASETFKKRQKEAAQREKQQKKTARRMERKNEKASTTNKLQEEEPKTAGSVPRPEPKELIQFGTPKYLSCLISPRDPKKKTDITLYAAGNRRHTAFAQCPIPDQC